MTTPRVTELPLRLQPVEPDPFIERPSRSSGASARRTERVRRERRMERVRQLMRVAARNRRSAATTERT
jgi:hypothetical protein